MLTVKDFLKNKKVIEPEKYYVILWKALWKTYYADEFNYFLFMFDKWSRIQLTFKDLSLLNPIEIWSWAWKFAFNNNLYQNILDSKIFEVNKKDEMIYKELYSVSINLWTMVSEAMADSINKNRNN